MIWSRMIWKKTHAMTVLGLVLMASLSGCKKTAEEAPTPVVTVQASHPKQGAISEEISADAILAPLSQAAISTRISAPIKAEYVQRGSHVRRGQLLIALDAKDLQASELDSRGAAAVAQANYTTAVQATIPEEVKKAELDVTQSKAALDVALRTSEERRKLFEQGALSGRDADTAYAAGVQAQVTYDTAAKHLDAVMTTTRKTNADAAEGQLASARGRLQNASAQAGYAELRSPIDGIVTERPLFPGETAAAGTTVITIMDTSSLLAKLHIAQAMAQKLSVGREATVMIPGSAEPVSAKVSFISPALDPGSNTVEVWLKLGNAGGELKAGTPVHVQISGETIANALQVPSAAILPTAEGSPNGSSTVMIVGADGAAHKRTVKLGVRTDDAVQVVSGLSASDLVITEGSYGLDEGTKVSVGKAAAAAEDKD